MAHVQCYLHTEMLSHPTKLPGEVPNVWEHKVCVQGAKTRTRLLHCEAPISFDADTLLR